MLALACARPTASATPGEGAATSARSVEPATADDGPVAGKAEPTTEPSCTSAADCPATEPGEPGEPSEPPTAPPSCAPLPEELLAVTGTIEGLRFTIPSNKGQIEPSSYARLDEIAGVLMRYPDVRLEVRAHEDAKTAESHRYMAIDPTRRQAQAVVRYFIEHGIAADRLAAQGYGEERPLVSNDTKEGRARNRRVELVVVPPEGCPASDPP